MNVFVKMVNSTSIETRRATNDSVNSIIDYERIIFFKKKMTFKYFFQTIFNEYFKINKTELNLYFGFKKNIFSKFQIPTKQQTFFILNKENFNYFF